MTTQDLPEKHPAANLQLRNAAANLLASHRGEFA
jgi:hypothetical protein